MAVRDGSAYLPQAIESILSQTLQDLELIVVDDGSRDATPDILAEFARQDRRVRVMSGEPSGMSAARNRAGREVRSRFLASMDADDVALPSRLELQVDFLDSHPDVVVGGGAGVFVDERGAELGVYTYPEEDSEVGALLRTGQSPVIHPAAAMRTHAFRAVSGYRAIFEVALDYDLWFRMADLGRITNIPAGSALSGTRWPGIDAKPPEDCRGDVRCACIGSRTSERRTRPAGFGLITRPDRAGAPRSGARGSRCARGPLRAVAGPHARARRSR